MGKKKQKNKQPETMEVHEDRAMIYLPSDAVQVEIIAKICTEDNRLINVSKILNVREIMDAFMDARDNYIEDDDEFVLTAKGKQYVKEHLSLI